MYIPIHLCFGFQGLIQQGTEFMHEDEFHATPEDPPAQRDSLSLRWPILVLWSSGIDGTGSPSDCGLSGQTGWEEEVKMPPEPKTSGDRALWELQQRRSGRSAGSIWSDPSKRCSVRRLLATSQLLPKSRPRPGYLLHILPQETLGNQEVFNSEV